MSKETMSSYDDNVALYEQDAVWNKDYLEDPYYRTKVRLIRGMIPDGVSTVLDVGCGNGTILNTLHSEYWVVGVDRSRAAIKYLKGQPVLSSGDCLPFKERSFDVVMSHQMLEHLPEEIFQRTVVELARVASRYLLVSVPYRDRIKQMKACCADCRFTYNVWGHVRSFDHIRDIRRLFSSFELRVHAFCGTENKYMSHLAIWVRQYMGGRWVVNPNAVCPRCNSKAQLPEAGYPRRLIGGVVDRIDRLLPKKKAFWWVVCLFERVQASDRN